MFIDVAELPPDPLAGTRYRTVGVIGCGGNSDVYEALGPKGDRFAIKVLRESHRGVQQHATRLLQEGRLLAAMNHPHLIPVLDLGMTWDNRPFLVMPRLAGQTLREYLTNHGPFEPNTAVTLLAGVLDGLHQAHRRGIVHRDVKPGNIFVETNAEGLPKRTLLFDFGIAKIAGAAAHRTTGECILSTPRYVSPEQILGGPVDGRADVYAMGIVLYESIAGRGPYDILRGADFEAQMRAHLMLIPRRLDEVSPASSALARIVAKALEKSPGKRFSTADEFAAVLRGTLPTRKRSQSPSVLQGVLP
ncbi:MAG TPA: serine/threonine-protein kinase [Polyangium sp.]|nr:serine/threonine-protein kinase [Polyangium sp.]